MAADSLAEALWNSLSAAAASPEGVALPVAILWTDPDAQWRPLVAELSKSFPELCTLGEFLSGQHIGPAIWLKCVVERTLPNASPPAGHVPVLYLPGVSRQVLRATPKISWDKDRGKEPQRAKADFPWFWTWDEATADFKGGPAFDGNRWNDCHYTLATKQAARERQKQGD